MKIERIELHNFLCYYSKKIFDFEDGLNIIIGKNGEGKTKFYEAIEWLFSNDQKDDLDLVSKKALAEVESERIETYVEIIVRQFGERKRVKKRFYIERRGDDLTTNNYSIVGIKENEDSGERNQVDGKELLEEIFPANIRKYSMFKGETQLNIFDNQNALVDLIDTFSKARYYDKYETIGQFLSENAQKIVDSEEAKNKKDKGKLAELQADLKFVQNEMVDCSDTLSNERKQLQEAIDSLDEITEFLNSSKDYKLLKDTIDESREEITSLESKVHEDYTKYLFDDAWILYDFEKVHEKYREKVSDAERVRRDLQSEFDRSLGEKQGEIKTIQKLLNGKIPLDVNIPTQDVLDEMLKEEICKVCGRDALKGSEAHNFISEKLNELLMSQKPLTNVEAKLFKSNYGRELTKVKDNLSENISHIRTIDIDYQNRIVLNKKLKDKATELNDFIEEEMKKLTAVSSRFKDNTSPEVILLNYDKLTKIKGDAEKLTGTLEEEYESHKKEEQDIVSQIKEIQSTFVDVKLIKIAEIFSDLSSIFSDVKEWKFNEFVQTLETKSNDIFSKVNVDAFTGRIKLHIKERKVAKRDKSLIEVQLIEGNGDKFTRPNQSLLTSMHLAILFAISELAADTKEGNTDNSIINRQERFPLIFDAPTSSFDETKKAEFLNLIYETQNQKILLLKDFIIHDSIGNIEISDSFKNVRRDKAFWIKLERPFTEDKGETINTLVIDNI
jgi:DNA sulfur modification protein DndD